MSDKMDLAKIVEKVVNRLMQEMSFKISDLCESYNSGQTRSCGCLQRDVTRSRHERKREAKAWQP